MVKSVVNCNCLGRYTNRGIGLFFLFQFGLLHKPFDRPTDLGSVLSKRNLTAGLIERFFVLLESWNITSTENI